MENVITCLIEIEIEKELKDKAQQKFLKAGLKPEQASKLLIKQVLEGEALLFLLRRVKNPKDISTMSDAALVETIRKGYLDCQNGNTYTIEEVEQELNQLAQKAAKEKRKKEMVSLQFQTRSDLKNLAEKILEEAGLTLPMAVELFYQQTIKEEGIPFDSSVIAAFLSREGEARNENKRQLLEKGKWLLTTIREENALMQKLSEQRIERAVKEALQPFIAEGSSQNQNQ